MDAILTLDDATRNCFPKTKKRYRISGSLCSVAMCIGLIDILSWRLGRVWELFERA